MRSLVSLLFGISLAWIFSGFCEEGRAEAPPAEIVLGMSTALTGPVAETGTDMLRGVQVGIERINQGGGIHGRKLRLIALDDGYEPARTAHNVRELVEKEKVLAIVGNVGTPTAIAAVPICKEQQTLFYAPSTGAGVLRPDPPDRYVINVRASYAEETGAMVDALVTTGGLKADDIVFFTQRDGYGDAGFAGAIAALKRHGLIDGNPILNARYERNSLAVENAVANVVLAHPTPRAVIMVGSYAPIAKFIRLCRNADLDILFLSVSHGGGYALARELGQTDARVLVTQVVPPPLGDEAPIAAQYRADLKTFDSKKVAGFCDLEGYVAMRIFALGLEELQGTPSRESVIDSLEGLGTFDIGLGGPLHLSPKEHQASHRVWVTRLQDGQFTPFDWSNIRSVLDPGGAR